MSLNTTSKQTAIKLGPHKGEEMYVMNVFVSREQRENLLWLCRGEKTTVAKKRRWITTAPWVPRRLFGGILQIVNG